MHGGPHSLPSSSLRNWKWRRRRKSSLTVNVCVCHSSKDSLSLSFFFFLSSFFVFLSFAFFAFRFCGLRALFSALFFAKLATAFTPAGFLWLFSSSESAYVVSPWFQPWLDGGKSFSLDSSKGGRHFSRGALALWDTYTEDGVGEWRDEGELLHWKLNPCFRAGHKKKSRTGKRLGKNVSNFWNFRKRMWNLKLGILGMLVAEKPLI